jgi:hypothetical protein
VANRGCLSTSQPRYLFVNLPPFIPLMIGIYIHIMGGGKTLEERLRLSLPHPLLEQCGEVFYDNEQIRQVLDAALRGT